VVRPNEGKGKVGRKAGKRLNRYRTGKKSSPSKQQKRQRGQERNVKSPGVRKTGKDHQASFPRGRAKWGAHKKRGRSGRDGELPGTSRVAQPVERNVPETENDPGQQNILRKKSEVVEESKIFGGRTGFRPGSGGR